MMMAVTMMTMASASNRVSVLFTYPLLNDDGKDDNVNNQPDNKVGEGLSSPRLTDQPPDSSIDDNDDNGNLVTATGNAFFSLASPLCLLIAIVTIMIMSQNNQQDDEEEPGAIITMTN